MFEFYDDHLDCMIGTELVVGYSGGAFFAEETFEPEDEDD